VSKEHRALVYAAWYQRNRKKADSYANDWRKRCRAELIEKFGSKCSACGESDLDVLEFDHVHDDGHLESGCNIIFSVKRNPSRFQLLCKNCNWRKELKRRRHALGLKKAS